MSLNTSSLGASFDVVVPCYNYGRFLRDAVESVLAQEVNLRILIIDDASQDDSAAVGRALAEEDHRVTFQRHARNRGHIATYNEGIAWANADFFMIFSADDIMLRGALARASELFLSDRRISMVHGRAIEFEEGIPIEQLLTGAVPVRPWMDRSAQTAPAGIGIPARILEERLPGIRALSSTTEFYRSNRKFNRVHTASVVSRTAVQKKVGGYRAELPHAGDYEMWLRLAAHGLVGYVPRFQAAIRRHAGNMSRQYDYEQDILQRALVLQMVETALGPILPEEVMPEMRASIATEAVRAAGILLAKGDQAVRAQLETAAIGLHPGVVDGMDWKLYRLKQMLGARAWNQVRDCKLRSMKAIGQVRTYLASARSPAEGRYR
ncbi:MAG TPA: glycosyltransferase family 2 protein [Rhizobiaceae bacterium]|nr:glycosyltransferase family 2 protein [Rhizobiaceae bacterium]